MARPNEVFLQFFLNEGPKLHIIRFLLYSFFSVFLFHRVVLVENIPEDISFLDSDTSHLPLSEGLYSLLDRAIRAVEIVSPLWLLNSSDYESSFQPAARQVKPEQVSRDSAEDLSSVSSLCPCLLYTMISDKYSTTFLGFDKSLFKRKTSNYICQITEGGVNISILSITYV